MGFLITQLNLACAYQDLRRPKDGIPLVIDALEKGEKGAVPECFMEHFRDMLVRPTRAIVIVSPSPLPLNLVPRHYDCSVGSMLIQKL